MALPLETINKESAREKSIRHGHPSTLHLWWARRPLAAARAVLFAQLVDDPSSHPDRFPTEDDQKRERARLFDLIERMVPWEATRDERIMREVREEIAKSCDGNPPPVLDPFAGGGTIPLEAQRLGLAAHASDLNPVPVLINKALIEIPPKWAGHKPVSPDAEIRGDWSGVSGLAEDVRRYGQWMRDEAYCRIGKHYPKVKLADGTEARVIAWLWARTVICPNPACGAEMPLASTWWLSKKKDRPRWIEPVIEGKKIRFEVRDDKEGPANPPKQGRGAKFACLVCGEVTADTYIKSEGVAGRMGATLLATVAEGKRQRIYLEATPGHVQAAAVDRPMDVPEQELAEDPRNIWCVNYGLTSVDRLFTPRQLMALTTLSDLVGEARTRVTVDAAAAGMQKGQASQYGDAVATYLGFLVSAVADDMSTLCSWRTSHGTGATRSTFARQALPMVWDYAESNPFGGAAGDLETAVVSIGRTIDALPASRQAVAGQADATQIELADGQVVSTDPPYYDNIGYADLSDFFYVWLRRSLGAIYPDIMTTILTPKQAELIASPYRHGGSKEKAEHHFESGFVETFTRIREGHPADFPLTVFYAFKQSETDDIDGTASTGWETMLNGLMEAGLTVTATWPVRTERAARSIGIGTNALASSIVLACRPRLATAETTDRRGFLNSLRKELPKALRELQQGNVAPVDMAQSAIGPGIAIYSRYAKVTESDGTPMRVRTALAMINDVLAEVLSEQEGDFDMDTRWCVKWFEQFQWERGAFGDAETLSRAYNTSVRGLEDAGVIKTGDSKVELIKPAALPNGYDPVSNVRISIWEVAVHLSRTLEGKGPGSGIDSAGEMLAHARSRSEVDDDTIKELAYLLYSVCERKGWSESGQWFNNLVSSWSDLQASARAVEKRGLNVLKPAQLSFGADYGDDGRKADGEEKLF
ncbi:DUF1156 domain-containing protein [Streptomyces sp. NPDC059970]|uniref:DUF1156 domain-containing protein n=1 Tax=Streptomyces sp. NPDC059970 TaxID=3347019 RepID=UPI0036AECBC1